MFFNFTFFLSATTASTFLCEIKDFEAYKNAYGNHKVDECWIKIARIIQNCAKRAIDLVARYREHQFAVILPNTDISLSLGIANMIPRKNLEAEVLIVAAENGWFGIEL